MSVHSGSQSRAPTRSAVGSTTRSSAPPTGGDQLAIAVVPPVVTIPDIEVGREYLVTVSVQNLSKRSQRIRFIRPATREFSLIGTLEQTIATGLQVSITVRFFATERKDFHDVLFVASEAGTQVEVPLHGLLPTADVKFDNFVNFGVVLLGSTVTKQIAVYNEGSVEGSFRFVYDESLPVKIRPASGTVGPRESATARTMVTVEFTPKEAGVFRALPQFDCPGQAGRLLDIGATVVSSQVHLMSADGTPLESIPFGPIYAGQERVFTALLSNPTPNPFLFLSRHHAPPEDDSQASSAPGDDDEAAGAGRDGAVTRLVAPVMTVEPQQGSIPALGTARVTFRFAPPPVLDCKADPSPDRVNDSLGKEYEQTALLEIVETGQTIRVPMTGSAIPPTVYLSQTEFPFGECMTNDRLDIMFTIKNTNARLPIDFRFSRVAHFRVSPPSGRLLPLQSCNAILTFAPHQMGRFTQSVDFIVNDGIFVLALRATGTSSRAIGKTLIGGPEAVPADFAPQRKFLEPGQVGQPSPRTLAARKPRTRAVDEFGVGGDLPRKPAVYHQPKPRPPSPTQRFINEVDIGLEPRSGLAPPEPSLPVAADPLYMEQPPNETAGVPGGGKSRGVPQPRAFDENVLIKKKFKPKPMTPAEINDCGMTLTPQQLLGVSASTKKLDFGRISIGAAVSKCLAITNTLKQNILVSLDVAEYDELALSTPLSQVIPPGATAGFDVTFCSNRVHPFTQTVTYTINGIHRNNLSIVAEAIPILVNLSRDKIDFKFSDDTSAPVVTETVILTNTAQSPAKFSWESTKTVFVVNPQEGTIPPGKVQEVQVTFRPESKPKNEETLTLKVEGGPSRQLVCVGEIGETKVVFLDKKLDMGRVCVGLYRERNVLLKNVGHHDAFWLAEQPLPGLTVVPMAGRIPPGAAQQITITLRPTMPMQYDTQLAVNVRGSKSVKLPLVAEADMPQAVVVEDEFDFGGVYVGATKKLPFTLTNPGEVECILFFELTNFPDFSLVSPPFEGDDEDNPVVRINSRDDILLTPSELRAKLGKQSAAASRAGSRLQDADTATVRTAMFDLTTAATPTIEAEDDPHRLYKLVLAPGQTLTCGLVFSPGATATHAFELPLQMAGLPVTPSIQRVVSGEGLKPPLVFSQKSVSFGLQVVLKERSRRPPYSRMIRLQNDDEEPLNWSLDLSAPALQNGTFRIDPSAGVLEPGESCDMRVIFAPKDAVVYSATVRTFIRGAEPYMDLDISGTGIFPMLTFDRKEVFLPVVPIGTTATTRFSIVNNGYETMQVRLRLPADQTRIPLQVTFTDGDVISVTKPQLPVEVSFTSPKPMAFTAKLDFFDADGNKFSIAVTGITDNSLLSLYPYIAAMGDRLQWSQPRGKGVTISEVEPDPEASKTASFLNDVMAALDEDHEGSKVAEVFSDTSIAAIVRWFNANVAKTPINNVPSDFTANDGRAMIEAIAFMSGKPPIAPPKGRAALTAAAAAAAGGGAASGPGTAATGGVNRAEKAQSLYRQYEQLLSFLKQHGALVNAIRPEFLLRLDDYWRVEIARVAKLPLVLQPTHEMRQAHRRMMERCFTTLSTQAWLSLLLHSVRVFMLGRITMTSLKALPGVDGDQMPSDPTLAASNVYTVAEGVLLKWLSYHYNKLRQPAQPLKLMRFDTELRDGTVLAAVLESHVPSLAYRFDKMRTGVTEKADVTANANRVIAAMRELGLDMVPTPEDFVECNPRDMALLVLYLYQTLPMYIPKATIEFQGSLNETVTRNLELTNPAAREVIYRVKLEGDPAFAIPNTVLALPPKGTVKFPIEFTSRFAKPVSARLTFVSKREGGVAGSTMVFLLQSMQTVPKASLQFSSSAPLYESATMDLAIPSPYSSEVTMRVRVQQPHQIEYPEALANTAGMPQLNLDAFHCLCDTVEFTPGGTANIQVQFLPLKMGEHRAMLVFSDERVGDFVVELVGKAELPAVSDTLKIQVPAKQSITKDFMLAPRNPGVDRARAQLVDRVPPGSKKRLPPKLREQAAKILEAAWPVNVTYDVEYSSPFFSGPPTLAVGAPTPKGAKPDDGAPAEAPRNQLLLEFHPQNPGVYSCRLKLTSPYDVRIINVEGMANIGEMQAALDFNVPARQALTQDIPVINNTSTPWVIKATLRGQYFSGPPQLTVPANSTGTYPLVFKPAWVCDVTGELVLLNTTTNDKYIYNLHGIADEPLAEDRVDISAQARTPTEVVVQVPNVLGNAQCQYTVESDVVGLAGEPRLTVPPNGTAPYRFTLTPHRSGSHMGALSFTAPGKEFVWFILQISATPPPPEGVVQASSPLHKAVVISISVTNPIPERLEFDVLMEGEGLLGEPVLEIGPQETARYELAYSPLHEGTQEGRIAFYNEMVGEFWYKLVLTGEPTPPTVLPEFRCAVGTTAAQRVSIDNPLNQEVALKAVCSNPVNFSVRPNPLVLPPWGSAEATIVYTRSSLDEVERGEVTFTHPQTGDWSFIVQGTGTAPDRMDPTNTSAMLGQASSVVLPFRNPFARPMTVSVSLVAVNPPEEQAFQLLKRLSNVTVPKFALLQIPCTFTPARMRNYEALVVVTGDGELTWKYPLRGTAETLPNNRTFRLRCRARRRVEEVVELVLPNLELDGAEESFGFEMKASREVEASLRRALTITPLVTRLRSADQPLKFRMVFEPLRPVAGRVDLVVYKESGGRWLYEVDFVASEPDVDDVIVLEADVGHSASVQFRLTNQFPTFAPFTAELTEDSPDDFTVYPTTGILEPYGHEGTPFVVTFSPKSYGKPVVGRLVILTDEMQWTYELRGSHRQYTPPTAAEPRVDTTAPEALRRLSPTRPRNFIQSNMRVLKSVMGAAPGVGPAGAAASAAGSASSLSRRTGAGAGATGRSGAVSAAGPVRASGSVASGPRAVSAGAALAGRGPPAVRSGSFLRPPQG